jgi:hypothetical protein
MITIEKIDVDLKPSLEWFEKIMIDDPLGRINNTTQKRKENGAQHTIQLNNTTFNYLINKIHKIARSQFQNYIINDIWTNVVLPNGVGNKKHIHIDSDIAGCFYIKVPAYSGDIEFETGERLTPMPGDLYWWDAKIPHWVHKNESIENRYSIAFNIKQI